MRRGLVLGGVVVLVVLLVSGVGAAVDRDLEYELFLSEDGDGTDDYRLDGTYGVDIEDGETVVGISVWMRHWHPDVTEESIDSIEMAFRYHPNHSVIEWEPDTGFTDGEVWEFSTEYGLDELNDLYASVTYTGENQTGHEVTRRPEGYIPFRTADLNQSVDGVGTNMSAVYRDGAVYVNGSASIMESVNLSWADASWGETVEVRDGTFEAWLPVPNGTALGEQERSVTVTSGQGNVFNESVSVTVENRPPTVDVSVDETIEEGENLSVSVDADDDTGVESVELVFAGETYTTGNRSAVFDVVAADLAPGVYDYVVSATDEDDASTAVNGTVEVLTAEEMDEQDDDGDDIPDEVPDEDMEEPENGEEEGEVGETTSVLIGVVHWVRETLEGILVG